MPWVITEENKWAKTIEFEAYLNSSRAIKIQPFGSEMLNRKRNGPVGVTFPPHQKTTTFICMVEAGARYGATSRP